MFPARFFRFANRKSDPETLFGKRIRTGESAELLIETGARRDKVLYPNLQVCT